MFDCKYPTNLKFEETRFTWKRQSELLSLPDLQLRTHLAEILAEDNYIENDYTKQVSGICKCTYQLSELQRKTLAIHASYYEFGYYAR